MRRLNKISFIWDINESKWEEMFTKLQKFKAAFGHCEVPDKWQKNPKLGIWVTAQRGFQKKGLLRADRFRRLDEIGFVWKSQSML